MAKLEIVDRRIARLKRKLSLLPAEPKENPEADTAPEQSQIRASQHTKELLAELSKLRSERGHLVQITMVLISQSDNL